MNAIFINLLHYICVQNEFNFVMQFILKYPKKCVRDIQSKISDIKITQTSSLKFE